ncbi:hypothetical protein [Flavobacterium sp.]|jgi:hypothetical protein|uniref:hypothetical protein n=1 Tax=Flavobacterium sp. TaxID=239 RepID=UPI0037BEFCD6
MSTIEIKKELHKIIDESDSNFIQAFYEIAKNFINKTDHSKLIEESEQDILDGKIHSLAEVKNIVKNWKE